MSCEIQIFNKSSEQTKAFLLPHLRNLWNYRKQRVKALKEEGYDICGRLAGSHGRFDVFAVNNEDVRLIQAKFDVNNAVIEKTKEELRKIVVPLCCKKEIWVKRSRQGWDIIEV